MSQAQPNRHYLGHHKCASNWMRRLFRDVCRTRKWGYTILRGRNNSPLRPAPGNPTLYLNANCKTHHLADLEPGDLAYHLIRDPRDAMVSGYWSWKNSHENNSETLLETRQTIRELSVEDGLMHMLDNIPMLEDLSDWDLGANPAILDVKYEDLLADTPATLARVLEHLQTEPLEGEIDRLTEAHAFKAITGRKPGEEDVTNHFRKGIAGDWQNAFTPRVARAFHDRYQPDLVRLGYETDDSWVDQVTDNQPANA